MLKLKVLGTRLLKFPETNPVKEEDGTPLLEASEEPAVEEAQVVDEISYQKEKKDPKELSTAAPKVRGKKYGKPLLVENTKESVKEIIPSLQLDTNLEPIPLADSKTKPDILYQEVVTPENNVSADLNLTTRTQQQSTKKTGPSVGFFCF